MYEQANPTIVATCVFAPLCFALLRVINLPKQSCLCILLGSDLAVHSNISVWPASLWGEIIG